MSNDKTEITELKNGKLVVKATALNGDIAAPASKKYITTLVQTSRGKELAVKVIGLDNGGGGGGGTVDQTYDATSTNAQSGTAVAEAVAPALKNTATGINSLTILGTATNKSYSLNIGLGSQAGANNVCVLGFGATARGQGSTVIGSSANDHYCTNAVCIGTSSRIESNTGIAIGWGAAVASSAQEAIQLGTGSNTTAKTFQVYTYPMLDGTTGLIPSDRIPTASSTVKGGVKIAFDSGTGVLNIITE